MFEEYQCNTIQALYSGGGGGEEWNTEKSISLSMVSWFLSGNFYLVWIWKVQPYPRAIEASSRLTGSYLNKVMSTVDLASKKHFFESM